MKNFDPSKVINFKYDDEEGIELGTTKPSFESITQFIDEWLKKMDKFLELEKRIYSYSDRYIEMMQQRGFSFDEFLELYDHNILEKDFYNYKVFEYYQIETEGERFIFLQKLDENKKDAYLKLIHNSPFSRSLSFFFDKLPAKLSLKDLEESHAYITGGSGSGKSALMRLLIYKLQKHYPECSLVLMDPHRDLAQEVYKSDLNKDPERIVYIDPLFKKGYTPVYNPFQVTTDDPDEINKLASNMQKIIELMLGEDITRVMSGILNPCITTLLLKGNSSFYDLARFFDLDNNSDLIELGMQSPFVAHREAIARIKTGYYSKSRDSIIGRIQNFRNQVVFDRFTSGKNTFNLEYLIESNKVTIISLPLGSIPDDSLDFVGRFMLAQIINIGMRRMSIPKHQRRKTFIFIDECQNFLSPSIKKAYNELRKYGIHFILASQYVELLGDLQESIVSNSAIKFIGRTGSKDTKTRLTDSGDISRNIIDTLEPLEFYSKVLTKTGYTFKVNKMLFNGRHELNDKQIEELDEVMLKRYYKPIEYVKQEPELPDTDPTPPFDIFIPDDPTS